MDLAEKAKSPPSWHPESVASGVSLRSAPGSPHVGGVEFTEGARRRGYFVCTATLLLDGEDWSVGLDMITPYLNDMVGFFEEIADARAGWSDKKWWESEFDELTIWASNEGNGLVDLSFFISWPPRYEDEQRGSFVARADELPRVAAEMREFTGLPGGSRFRRFGRDPKEDGG